MKVVAFVLGLAVGALTMAGYASTHPRETQSALKKGADHIGDAVSAGAASARNYADQQLPQAAPAGK